MHIQNDAVIATAGTTGVAVDSSALLTAIKRDNENPSFLDKFDSQILMPVQNADIRSEIIARILDNARNGMSARFWPWHTYVVSEPRRHAIREEMVAVMNQFLLARNNKYKSLNRKWHAPHKLDKGISYPVYQAFNALEPDKGRLLKAYYHGIHLLHSPAFAFFTVERSLAENGWLEFGGFLNRIAASAADFGLVAESAGFIPFHDTIRKILKWTDAEMPVIGMSMQYASVVATGNAKVLR